MGEQQQLEPKFTPREHEVLERLSRGHTNFAIAQDLGITLDGAKWHVGEILSKLGVGSREEAAAYWLRQSRLATMTRPTKVVSEPDARARDTEIPSLALHSAPLFTLARRTRVGRV